MSLTLHERPECGESDSGSTAIDTIAADSNIIILFGCTGVGKTSFANVASGSSMRVGKGMKSSTKHVEPSNVFKVDERPIVLIDCPGFDDTYLPQTEVLRRLSEFLIAAYTNNRKIVGLIYMHKITDTRVGGVSLRHMNMFKALCGPESLNNAVYVTTMWSQPPTEDELAREVELRDTTEFFKGSTSQGAQVARHSNTRESAHEIIRLVLNKPPIITHLQHQLVDQHIDLIDTDIGQVLGEDLDDAIYQQKQEVEELGAQKQRAFEANDREWARRLEIQERSAEERERRLRDQIRSLKEGSRSMAIAHKKPGLGGSLDHLSQHEGEKPTNTQGMRGGRRAKGSQAAPVIPQPVAHVRGVRKADIQEQNSSKKDLGHDEEESDWDRQRRRIEKELEESERQMALMDRKTGGSESGTGRQVSSPQNESGLVDLLGAVVGVTKVGYKIATSFMRRR